jgi:hypothetical protein
MSGPDTGLIESFKEGPIAFGTFLVIAGLYLGFILLFLPATTCDEGWTSGQVPYGKYGTICNGSGDIASETDLQTVTVVSIVAAFAGFGMKRLVRGDEYVRMQRELNARAAASRAEQEGKDPPS